MPWPARLDDLPIDSDEPGTIYTTPSVIGAKILAHHHAGRAWRFRYNQVSQWSTYAPSRYRSYKVLNNLNPESAEDFAHIMTSAEAAGCTPPSSFTALFRSQFATRMPQPSIRSPFYGARFGHWETTFFRGAYSDPVWHYDLNKAFRWTTLEGLPDLWSGYRTRRWDDEACACYLVDLPENSRPYATAEGRYVVTSEEREMFSIKPLRVIAGVGFSRLVSFTDTWAKIDQAFPWCFSRISRAFWASWNSTQGPDTVTWKQDGPDAPHTRVMRNPFHNPIWSAFITSRVKIRIAQWLPSTLLVFADSLLSKEEIPTGDAIGDFRCLAQYPSIWIRGAGAWGTGTTWLRHAGLVTGKLPAVREDGRPVT